jgi:tRNA-dihydrouridine synthase B
VGLACTDLLSPQGLLRGTATSLDLAKTNAFDKPVGMQLYGSDPEIMAQGARWAVEHGATIVDINMGCPVDKVTKKDGGSALLTDLSRAVAIAKRVREELERCPLSGGEWDLRLGSARHLDLERAAAGCEDKRNVTFRGAVPLTCKMRLCWSTSDYDSGNACSPMLARMLADVGVAAVTVHGRTTEMKFSGEVIRPGIARVVEAVAGAIPVVGNGDVRSGPDAARMLSETGCQGVMIGRGALSTPWLFRECQHYITTGEVLAAPTEAEQLTIIRHYFDMMRTQRDDRYALFQINRRISWFAKNMQRTLPNGKMETIKPFKEAIRLASGPDAVYEALERFGRGELRGGSEESAVAEHVQ